MNWFDHGLLDGIWTSEVRAGDVDSVGRYEHVVGAWKGVQTHRLRNRHAVPSRRDILSVRGWGPQGDLWPSCTFDQLSQELEVEGDGHPFYSLFTALSGALEAAGPNGKAEVHGTMGMILRGLPGTKLATSDGSLRLGIWMDAARLERTLEARIGEPLRERLAFAPSLDLSSGHGRVVWRMITHLLEETRDPEGLTSDPVARETFTDLFLQTVLSRLQHNYTSRLERPTGVAIPRHVRRAEAFMHANADQPIAMADVAVAAGCGTATLYAAFRQFRGTTPLAALHAIRLQRVREALREADDQISTRAIARRFGFTNPSRFLAAYGKRFGEHPNEARRG
jgi:AraC-like DNA-binding protein